MHDLLHSRRLCYTHPTTRPSHSTLRRCRRVCTPCYRAPEVVLARGRYSSAMDMWSLGCIFGELLQRMERTGASFTPNLAIMPVFQFSTWSPNTPDLGVSLRDTDDAIAGRVRPPWPPSRACVLCPAFA